MTARTVAELRKWAEDAADASDADRKRWLARVNPLGLDTFTAAGGPCLEEQGKLARELLAALDVVEAAAEVADMLETEQPLETIYMGGVWGAVRKWRSEEKHA